MVLRHAVDQPNRWAFRCRAKVDGERVAVRRAAGKLFQMIEPATAKLLIPSVVLVLGTNSNPVPADCRCRLPTMSEIARQWSAKLNMKSATAPKRLNIRSFRQRHTIAQGLRFSSIKGLGEIPTGSTVAPMISLDRLKLESSNSAHR